MMTPPNSLNGQASQQVDNMATQIVTDAMLRDDPDDMTFDELREMPMRLALSFDCSLDH